MSRATMVVVPLTAAKTANSIPCPDCGVFIVPIFAEDGVPSAFVDVMSLEWLDQRDCPDDRTHRLLYGESHRCPSRRRSAP